MLSSEIIKLWIYELWMFMKQKSTVIQLSMKVSPELTQVLATTLFSSLLPPSNIVKPKFNKMDSTKCNSTSQIWVRGSCLRKMGTLKVDIAEINLSSLAFNCVISEKF